MEICIDIQFCIDSKNNYFPKEIGILSLNNDFYKHWIVEPPCEFSALPLKARKQNNFLTRQRMGLLWSQGDVSHEKIIENFKELDAQVTKIYVRGAKKADYLKNYLNAEIVDLEQDETCPSFAKLVGDYTRYESCLEHRLKFRWAEQVCALNRAGCLRSWLMRHDE